jgi:hypothetical protein
MFVLNRTTGFSRYSYGLYGRGNWVRLPASYTIIEEAFLGVKLQECGEVKNGGAVPPLYVFMTFGFI